jgi:hypothetical protein
MAFCQAYKWNKTPSYTDRFSIVTKYYDFGSVQVPTTIYSVGISVGITGGDLTSVMPSVLTLFYRTSLDEDFLAYGQYQFTKPDTYVVHKKLNNVSGLQLKVTGILSGETYINDLSVEFRNTKKRNVGSER